jgi:hypothetical protein
VTGGEGVGGTVLGAGVSGGGGGITVLGTGAVADGAGGGAVRGGVVRSGVLEAGIVTGAGGRGGVVAGQAAPFTRPAGRPLLVAAREPELRANARLIPPAATRAIKAKMIPSRLVMSWSFDLAS